MDRNKNGEACNSENPKISRKDFAAFINIVDPINKIGDKEIRKSQLDCLRKLLNDNKQYSGDDRNREELLRELIFAAKIVDGRIVKFEFCVECFGPIASDISALAGLTSLRGLSLEGNPVRNISVLKKLPHLKWVDVSSTPLKTKQLRALKKARPNLNIYSGTHPDF